MKFIVITCLLALSASTQADGSLGLGGLVYAPGHASVDYYAYPRYAFEYAVKDPHTGDNKAQWEKRDGDVVKGAYSLVEPDGSLRVVEYWADDKSGFNAVVKRLGPNLHPVAPIAPIYKAPIPVLSSGPVVAPITIGPVAKYGGLASAPLLSGHLGGAISSAAISKPISPILPAPILSAPVYPSAPILRAPILPPAPILPAPIIKPAPYYPSLSGSYLSAPLSSPLGLWGSGALKGPSLGLGPVLPYLDGDIGSGYLGYKN